MAIIKLTNLRLSFPDLFDAKQYQGEGEFKYKATFLVPKGSPQAALITESINKLAAEKLGAKAKQILPGLLANPNKTCWTDGDLKAYDGYSGNMALSASRRQEQGRVKVVNADTSPLTKEDGKPYAGCYVNAHVEFWLQANGFGHGIRCALHGVQFLRDGESFAPGSSSADVEFDDVGEESTVDDLV